jgi:hypothetical protein
MKRAWIKTVAVALDDVPFHGDERRQWYRIYPLLNYSLDAGTPPMGESVMKFKLRQGP